MISNNFEIVLNLPPLGRRNIPLNQIKCQLLKEVFKQEIANVYAEREEFSEFCLGRLSLFFMDRRIKTAQFKASYCAQLLPYFQNIGFAPSHANDIWKHLAADLCQPLLKHLSEDAEVLSSYIQDRYYTRLGLYDYVPTTFEIFIMMNFYTGWTWAESTDLALTGTQTLVNLNPIPDSYAQQYWTK